MLAKNISKNKLDMVKPAKLRKDKINEAAHNFPREIMLSGIMEQLQAVWETTVWRFKKSNSWPEYIREDWEVLAYILFSGAFILLICWWVYPNYRIYGAANRNDRNQDSKTVATQATFRAPGDEEVDGENDASAASEEE